MEWQWCCARPQSLAATRSLPLQRDRTSGSDGQHGKSDAVDNDHGPPRGLRTRKTRSSARSVVTCPTGFVHDLHQSSSPSIEKNWEVCFGKEISNWDGASGCAFERGGGTVSKTAQTPAA